jgi:acylphosphatase
MAGQQGVSAVDVVVRGQVQGVGFRFHCLQEADRLGVAGWVRNEPDGTVAGHFEGTSDAVRALVDWCRSGPAYAAVTSVEDRPAAPTGARTFRAG